MFFLGFFLCLLSTSVFANQVHTFTNDGPSSKDDTRYLYERGLLELALEQTVDEYGDYTLDKRNNVTHARALLEMTKKMRPNYIRSFGYSEDLSTEHDLAYIPIPIFRGALGFRTCFTHKSVSKAFSEAKTLEELRRFSHGQGVGWLDVDILKHNGFKVYESPTYDGLFKMISLGRIDLFCRGATEVRDEYERYKDLDSFAYDKSKMFFYPYPNFFYTHKDNTIAIERIGKGLKKALENGAFEKFWLKLIGPNVRFSMEDDRTLIILENPLLDSLDSDFEKYYHPIFLDKLNRSSPLPEK